MLANAAAALLEISERSNDFQLVVSDSAANLLADSLGAASEYLVVLIAGGDKHICWRL